MCGVANLPKMGWIIVVCEKCGKTKQGVVLLAKWPLFDCPPHVALRKPGLKHGLLEHGNLCGGFKIYIHIYDPLCTREMVNHSIEKNTYGPQRYFTHMVIPSQLEAFRPP